MNQPSNKRFKFFPQLNDIEDTAWMNSRSSINLTMSDTYFNGTSLQDTFLQALAGERLLPIKEVLECFEFFNRIRKQSRAQCVADLCCGHGLLGILFAMFERKVERVLLIDKVEPPSRQKLIDCASRVAPWIADKLENKACKISPDDEWIEEGCSIVSAHACGSLSDLCIEIAIKSGGALAILPCCYPRAACKAPQSVQLALGFETAFDVDRTYRMEQAGYQVRWAEIPPQITPMNRVIMARK